MTRSITVFGTGAVAGLSCPERALPVQLSGLDISRRPGGFIAHLNPDAGGTRAMRKHALAVLIARGVDRDTAESAQLVLSELLSNAIRACGEDVSVVVEVYASGIDAMVTVHDPLAHVTPNPSGVQPDNPEAESGRGLAILDSLAPGWTVGPSQAGKYISCRIPAS